MITCAIVDDEPLALELLKCYVEKTPQLKLEGIYGNAVEALGCLPNHPVDLLFLDIQMPELNGLEFSRLVSEKTRIVFTTAFSQYALEGFRVNALDYLLKPISYADFLGAVNRAQAWFSALRRGGKEEISASIAGSNVEMAPVSESPDGSIFVKSDYKMVRVFLNDILYVEGVKDYVKICLSAPQKHVLCLTSMQRIEHFLPSDIFYRVHRSFIVNMEKVQVMERGQIVFGEKHIPISESYKDGVQAYIARRLLQGR